MEPFVLASGLSDRIRALGKRMDENWDFETCNQIERNLRTNGLHGIAEAMENGMVLACTHIADGVYGWCLIPQPAWSTKPVSQDHPELVKGNWKIGKKIVTQKFLNTPLFLRIRYGSRKILVLSEQEWTDLHSLGRRNFGGDDHGDSVAVPTEDLPTPETDSLAEMTQDEINELADEIFSNPAVVGPDE